ncbi:MAG: hypothetical protein PVG90_10555 [Bacillota bacterium]|jgi:hypothetical protein
MRKRVNLPGQLPLSFENSSYLSWIEHNGEKYEEFEMTARKLIVVPLHDGQNSAIRREIEYALECSE